MGLSMHTHVGKHTKDKFKFEGTLYMLGSNKGINHVHLIEDKFYYASPPYFLMLL